MSDCKIKIAGDSTWCETCGLRWDTNDRDPPPCPNPDLKSAGALKSAG